jgi:hypothetical protein
MSTKKLLLLLTVIAAVLALNVAPAPAQSGLRQVPLGFCPLSSMTGATSLTSCSGGIPANTTYAVICAYTQGVVWRDDGVAPTGTPGSGGQGLSAGACIPYNGTFTAIQFIQQASGALLGVTFYK